MTRVFEAGQRWVRRNGDGGEFPRDDDSVILFVDIGSSGSGSVTAKSVRTMNFGTHRYQEQESIRFDCVTKWDARAFSAAHSRIRGTLTLSMIGFPLMSLLSIVSAVGAYVFGARYLEQQAYFTAGYAICMLSVLLDSHRVKTVHE